MHGKGKMKVSFLILIAAFNLFMHVNSTEKRRITCGKRAIFLYIYFSLSDSLIPFHKLISGINSFLPYSASSPVARDPRSLSTLVPIILLSRISLVSLGLSPPVEEAVPYRLFMSFHSSY